MIRSAASKVMWVGRATVFLVGLAVILALIFGVASMALGANGQSFLLGKANVASALTKLTGNVNGSAMQVVNSNAGADDTALNLSVQAGEAPMRVNSSARVTNLNADKLDGHDAPLWSVVDAEGNVDRQSGNVTASSRTVFQGPIFYIVTFDRNVSSCAFSATNYSEPGEITAENASADPKSVRVETHGSEPQTSSARAFHLVVFC